MDQRCRKIVHKALAVVRPQFRLHFGGGIHGLPYWSRVWFHGLALAASLDVDPAVLAWLAYLHDSQRHHDGRDPEHGARAADFAVQLRRKGVINELDDSAFERLCEAMGLHSDGHTTGDATALACWDTDRSDLARVGIRPQPQRMCTSTERDVSKIRAAERIAEGLARRVSGARTA